MEIVLDLTYAQRNQLYVGSWDPELQGKVRRITDDMFGHSSRSITQRIRQTLVPYLPRWCLPHANFFDLDHIICLNQGGSCEPENLGFLPSHLNRTGGRRAAEEEKLRWWGELIRMQAMVHHRVRHEACRQTLIVHTGVVLRAASPPATPPSAPVQTSATSAAPVDTSPPVERSPPGDCGNSGDGGGDARARRWNLSAYDLWRNQPGWRRARSEEAQLTWRQLSAEVKRSWEERAKQAAASWEALAWEREPMRLRERFLAIPNNSNTHT